MAILVSTSNILGIMLVVIGLVDLLLGVVVLPRQVRNPGSASLITLVMGISGFAFIIAGVLLFAGLLHLP